MPKLHPGTLGEGVDVRDDVPEAKWGDVVEMPPGHLRTSGNLIEHRDHPVMLGDFDLSPSLNLTPFPYTDSPQALSNSCTLAETNRSHLKMDGWKMKSPLGEPIFSCY